MSSSVPPPSTKAIAIEPGTRLDRYELLCLLAHGGMANIWLARVQGKLGFHKLLAIKTILQHEADNETFREMFLDEAKIASRIDHPSVVRIVDVGELSGIPYLVMDLIEGEPLHKVTRACDKISEKLPLGIALRIVADACQGLHAAHEVTDDAGHSLGVVHRDISPQNILVTTSGISKVIDFGIAKARDRSARQTTTGTLKGKISYMPREQALGKDVDRRADTWALGAVLYFLLSGDPPYKGETQLATLQLAMSGAPVDPLPSGVPLPVRSLVSRALSQPIEKRFQTAAEMSTAIEKVMQTLGVVTSHADVAKYLGRVMKDKLEARKALIANAIEEAAKREKAREQLTVPIELEIGDTEMLNRNLALGLASPHLVAPTSSGQLPSATMGAATASGSQPDLASYGSLPGTGPGTSPGTDGGSANSTFGAAIVEPFPPRRNGIAIATMVLAAMAIIGAAGVGAFLYVTRIRPPIAAPVIATTASAPAEPAATAPAAAPPSETATTSATAASASATATATAKTAAKAPTPVKGATIGAGTWRPSGAKGASTGKKRDDEAGF